MTKRKIECELVISADADTVWRAITQAEHISNWFAPYAESNPGPEGFIKLGWRSPDNLDELSILEWEPGKHLRTTWYAAPEGQEPVLLPVDITLESTGRGTVLKLVHAGFLSDQSWDDEFESHSRGWNTELRSLRYYLEHQFKRTRHFFKRQLQFDGDVAQAIGWVVGPDGILRGQREGLRENDSFQLRLPGGELTTCKVLYELGTTDFVFICDALEGGFIRLAIENMGDNPELWFWAFSWTLAEDQLVKLVEPWYERLKSKLRDQTLKAG